MLNLCKRKQQHLLLPKSRQMQDLRKRSKVPPHHSSREIPLQGVPPRIPTPPHFTPSPHLYLTNLPIPFPSPPKAIPPLSPPPYPRRTSHSLSLPSPPSPPSPPIILSYPIPLLNILLTNPGTGSQVRRSSSLSLKNGPASGGLSRRSSVTASLVREHNRPMNVARITIKLTKWILTNWRRSIVKQERSELSSKTNAV